MKRFLFLVLFSVGSAYSQTDTITMVTYNLLNFPDGRDDCSSNTVVQDRADTLQKIMAYTKPDILAVCEIQNQVAEGLILNQSLNYAGAPNYAAASYTPDGSLNNMLFYNMDLLTLYAQHEIATFPREIDHYVLYMNDPNLGTYFDTTFIDVYMCHLKAGNSSSNEQIRATQVEELMAYVATQPTDHNHFVCGDLNVYSANETGYQLLTSGPFAFQDPINAPGNWNNNGSFDYLHTQSTRTSQNFDCGSKGGLDDRFDQILVSSNVMSGSDSLKYLPNSYAAIGNDGNHFNANLLQGSNSLYPADLVSALYYMSDHLPVLLKAVVTYPTSNGLALNPSSSSVSCYGSSDGSATITANAGQPPYTYLWDNASGNQTTQTATGLSSGQYCVLVTDDLGETDSYCIYVPTPAPISFNYFVQPEDGSCNGAIYFLVDGGAGMYDFEWSGGVASDSSSAEGLCSGTYVITISDAAGCDTTVTVQLGTTSLEDQDSSTKLYRSYPNPFTNQLNVRAEEIIYLVELYDPLGRSLPLEINEISPNHMRLALDGIPSGMYTVRVNETRMKVVKNNP